MCDLEGLPETDRPLAISRAALGLLADGVGDVRASPANRLLGAASRVAFGLALHLGVELCAVSSDTGK
jgi:hypothetical protein